MGLTELKVRNAKPGQKQYKLYDGDGLYLLVTPRGKKYWRFDYRYDGKRKTISFGKYPEVSLAEARKKRLEARKLLYEGIDPTKKSTDQQHTFDTVAWKWFGLSASGWADNYKSKVKIYLNYHILPVLGRLPLSQVTREKILSLIESITRTGKIETARRCLSVINRIIQYAVDNNITASNPSTGLTKYIPHTTKRHYPTILDPLKIGKLLKDIEKYKGNIIVKYALLMLAYTFVRPGELREAKWQEFNLDEQIWDIPAERMKTRRPHRVFLSRQCVEILKHLKELTGQEGYVFKGRLKEKPVSDVTLNKALRVMGYNTKTDITGHGFRAMARTLIHEKLNYSPEVIEHQLAHTVPDRLGEAYNRTKFYAQRKKMMQDWADYLDSLKNSLQAASD